MEAYSLVYSSSYRGALLSRLQRLRGEGRMCDVVLETGGRSFPCHRALLASSSDYFWALFGETTPESGAAAVSLPAVTPQGLESVLDFLYSGWLSLSPASLPAALEASRYLQVEAAVKMCERFIADGLTAATCCGYANLAEGHALGYALADANYTIATEMRTLLRHHRQELLELNGQSLTAALEAEEIPGVEEAELVALALDWLDANGPLPLLKSNLLLSRLRFGLVPSCDLMRLSGSHKALATPLVRSQLTKALEYHRLGSAQPIRQTRQSSLRASPNRVLLVGGGESPDWPGQQILTFDLRDSTFSPLKSRLPRRLRNHCVCSVGGFLFVIGGDLVSEGDEGGGGKSVATTTSNEVWRYDPRFDEWVKAASMLERRSRFCCCVVADVIYAIGGRQTRPGAPTHTALSSVECYNMAHGGWRRGAAMPRPLHGHASAVLGTAVYVSGGIPGNPGGVRCPPGVHADRPEGAGGVRDGNRGDRGECSRELLHWEPGAGGKTWEPRASMSIARFGHRMAALGDHLYALLGMHEPFCDIERYDWPSDHWTRLRPLTVGASCYGMAKTPSGTLLLFGGRKWSEGQEVTVRSVLEYDVLRDRWKDVCLLPEPLTGTECTLLPLPDWGPKP
ncbi:LOW QUALITY PROTEIN: kelch-like protein 34 [Gadus chalcogrammus]|uniref:LOW QUALITY PROTEIN: kelch-like protein 34 n=1 Tax=Gadus chalcogrammus TaxID=1042646 RepID=UPI0024C4E2B5|nr:LOW QUALITY PROTEIN: kelch-like protein 34 [Gadus chalcogrammus]